MDRKSVGSKEIAVIWLWVKGFFYELMERGKIIGFLDESYLKVSEAWNFLNIFLQVKSKGILFIKFLKFDFNSNMIFKWISQFDHKSMILIYGWRYHFFLKLWRKQSFALQNKFPIAYFRALHKYFPVFNYLEIGGIIFDLHFDWLICRDCYFLRNYFEVHGVKILCGCFHFHIGWVGKDHALGHKFSKFCFE